jgi:hypothetical protein
MAHMGKVKNTYRLSVMKPEERHGRSSVYHYILYILVSNPHSVFGNFLNGKKIVYNSNLHLSFNCPLPTG